MPEKTLVLIKPDALRRGLTGRIISRFEVKGLRLTAMKMLLFDQALSKRHYAEHIEKPFYPDLETFITSGPSIALVIEGNDAIELVRKIMGKTSHLQAAPGTIRGDFASSTTKNMVHGSDSRLSAEREIYLFFQENEIF